MKKQWWLYILELQDGKYYVGITSKTPQIRMQEHLNGVRVAYWTAKHKPVKIKLEEDLGLVSKQHAENYENKVTRDLMKQHGINNVRGGDLTSTEDYIQRFGYIRYKKDWSDAIWGFAAVILLFGFIIYIIFREGIIQL